MKIQQALEANPTQPILFISDPTNGDAFVFGNGAENFETPATGTAELTTTQDLLDRLDFEIYEENQPAQFLAARDGTFIRIT